MKQSIEVGTVLAMFAELKAGDDSKLEPGDYVVAVKETHGWADVRHGMVGKVKHDHGASHYEVDFGKVHRNWRGDRSCFFNLGKELSEDIYNQLRQAQNEKFMENLKIARDSGEEYISIRALVYIQSIRQSGCIRVQADVPLKSFSRLRTYAGFRKRLVELMADEISSKVHPTRVQRFSKLSAMGVVVEEVWGEEITKKMEV